jgi:hypothetical protein
MSDLPFHQRLVQGLLLPAIAALFCSCSGSGSGADSQTTSNSQQSKPTPLVITTASLPNGQVGSAYSATLAASGGTPPYTWSLSSGSLPAGLSLHASSGAITGTPTATVSAGQLTFKVTDAETPAQTQSVNLTVTIAPATLTITTTSLQNGSEGSTYSAMLAARGGTPPYKWSLSGGTLPPGLALNASSGAITGKPTATVAATPLTFTVADSGSPAQNSSVKLTLTIGPPVTVSVSPARAGVPIGQTLQVTATTTDPAGVTWSISPTGGSFSPTSSASGTAVTLRAPPSAGVYTVTATSVSNSTQSASLVVGVTDLAGVYTYHNDLARDGANTQEYALTTANVNTGSFGKLFSCPVDGAVYAQPLWVSSLSVGGATHNVVFVATEHDSLFAVDADASPCLQLWQVSLIDTNHGGLGGELTVPSGTSGNLVGAGYGNITPEVGVTGTPVIDPASNTLYVVSKSMNSAGTSFYQRLHAIDMATGKEKSGSPVTIAATFPGTGDGGTSDAFNPQSQNQRPGLTFANGNVYIAWSSHEDWPTYYGWIVGYSYNGSAFTQTAALNVTPNVQYGGIWMSGGAPAVDSNGSLYLLTGNGAFDATASSGPTNDYGDSFLQMTSGLVISSWFSPSDQLADYQEDHDFGSGGAAIVLNLPSGSPQHLVVGGGKDGTLYLLNGDSMGGSGDGNARQYFSTSSGMFSTGAFWNSTLYVAPSGGSLLAYSFNTSTNLFATSAASQSTATFAFPGMSPSVSASGAINGIVWGLDNSQYCTPRSPGCGPAVLHAYSATTLHTELWNSSMIAGDAAGYAVKFNVPTVANGKVYVGTRGNNTGGAYGSTTVSGELDVYGLKPN